LPDTPAASPEQSSKIYNSCDKSRHISASPSRSPSPGHRKMKYSKTKKKSGVDIRNYFNKRQTEAPQKKHKDTTHADLFYYCDCCDFKCDNIHDFKSHIESTHNILCCPDDECTYKTKDKSNLKKHVNAIHIESTHNILCCPDEECTYKTKDKSNLRKHVKAVHEHKDESVTIIDPEDIESPLKTASRKRKSRRIESSDEEDSDGNTEDRPSSSPSASFKKFKMNPKVDIEKPSAKKIKEVSGASPPTISTTSKAKRKLNTLRSSDEEEEDDEDEPKPKVVYVKDAIDQFIAACKNILPKEEAESVDKKLNKHVTNLSPEFVSCPKLKLLIDNKCSFLDSHKDNIYVYVKNVLDQLKKHKKVVDSEGAQTSNNQSSEKEKGDSIDASSKKNSSKGTSDPSKTSGKEPRSKEGSKTSDNEPRSSREPSPRTEEDSVRILPSRHSKIKASHKKLGLKPQVDIRNYFQNIDIRDPHKFVINARKCKNDNPNKKPVKKNLDETITLSDSEIESESSESESESSGDSDFDSYRGRAKKSKKSKSKSSAKNNKSQWSAKDTVSQSSSKDPKVDIMLDKLRQNGFSVHKNGQPQTTAATKTQVNPGPANKENSAKNVSWNDINFEHQTSCVQECLMMKGMQRSALVAAGVFMASTLSLNPNYIAICMKIEVCCVRLGDLQAGRDILAFLNQLASSPGINDVCKSMIGSEMIRHRTQVFDQIDRHEKAAMMSAVMKDYPAAFASLDFALRFAPGCLRLQIMRGDCLAFMCRYAEAATVLSSILLKDPTNVAALYQMGYCLFHGDQVERSISNFQQVLQISPSHTQAASFLSRAKQYKEKTEAAAKAEASNRLKEAHTLYMEICEIVPRNKTTYANILLKSAQVLEKMKMFDESMADLNKALEVDSNCVAALLQRANYYLRQKELEKAVNDFEKLQNLDMHKQQNKKTAAEIALKSGAREEAYNLFCEAIEVDRHNQTYKTIYRKAKKDFEAASRKDYYKILGIEKACEESAIRKGYFKKSKEYHPDRHANADEEQKNEFQARFTEVKLAYEVLSDKQKKAMYDSGNDGKSPPGGGWYCPLNPRLLNNLFPEKFKLNSGGVAKMTPAMRMAARGGGQVPRGGGQVPRGGRQAHQGPVGGRQAHHGPVGGANNIHEANRRMWQEEALAKEAIDKNNQLSREEAKIYIWVIMGDAGQRHLAKVKKEMLGGSHKGKTRGGRGKTRGGRGRR